MEAAANLIEDEARIGEIVRAARRIAVLGMRPESHAGRAAHYVPAYLARIGADVVPVPVHHPEVAEILGRKVYRRLADVPGPIDIVDVFRRPTDIPPHLADMKAARPRVVWFQSGIRNDQAARELAAAGILVVQDRCLMVEWRRWR